MRREDCRQVSPREPDDRLRRAIQHAAAIVIEPGCRWDAGSSAFADDDSGGTGWRPNQLIGTAIAGVPAVRNAAVTPAAPRFDRQQAVSPLGQNDYGATPYCRRAILILNEINDLSRLARVWRAT
jgi:hypothetical protein